jgi:hypothetical protein
LPRDYFPLFSKTSTTFLILLHQQLNCAMLIGGDALAPSALQSTGAAAKLTSDHCDWNDIALLVNEQVSVLVSQHNRAQDKVRTVCVVIFAKLLLALLA